MTSTLILSPHCDDAPLSLGACLQQGSLGADPTVVVVFSKSRFTKYQSTHEDVIRVTAMRMEEEAAAGRHAGYRARFLEFAEPAVRKKHCRVEEIFDLSADVRDDQVWKPVLEAIEGLTSRHCELVLAPLGAGGHIDHRLVNTSALQCLQGNPDLLLGFYEDLPYVDRQSDSDIECLVPKSAGLRWKPLTISGDLDAKLDLLRHYPSQPDHSTEVRHYWGRRGGERIWLPEKRWEDFRCRQPET